MKTLAPAKINLYLHITGRRDDGYHLLDSLVVFADIGDEIEIEESDRLKLSVTGEFAAGLADDDNLVLKAARILAEKAATQPDIHIKLKKNIPVGAGLGGGSADAAAVIKLLNNFWQLNLSDAEMNSIGLELGADIPVCLYGRSAYMSGIGEIIEPAQITPLYLVLVNPDIHISTKEIFEMGFDFTKSPNNFSSHSAVSKASEQNPEQFIENLSATRNDLTRNALKQAPQIGDILEELQGYEGCRLARMSGSGSTCFGLFTSRKSAESTAYQLQTHHPDWWIKALRVT